MTEALLELGTAWGAGQMRKLRPAMLARYGVAGGVRRPAGEAGVGGAVVAAVWWSPADVTEYQLVMTPEQAAVLEAAIGPLSAPAPNEETGERDLRPAGQRRVEALAEVCRRSSAGWTRTAQGADGAAG